MKIFDFSMDWFKSEKQKQMQDLEIEEQKLKVEYLKKSIVKLEEIKSAEKPQVEKEVVKYDKPYKQIKFSNNVLTIVGHDGEMLTKVNATEDDFQKARIAKNYEDLLDIIVSKEIKHQIDQEIKEYKELKVAVKTIDIIKDYGSPEFTIKDESVYLTNIDRSIPLLLVQKFAEILQKYPKSSEISFEKSPEFLSLKKFWLKCCLNPNAQSAEDLYGFLAQHNFKIDKHGNFYAYRRVQSVGDKNKEFIDFISNAYNKIKAVWKKKPSDYAIYEGEEGFYFWKITSTPDPKNDGKYCAGNLETLFKGIPGMKENRYTSKHTGKEDYRVGEVISMPRNEGDDNNSKSCSFGFHAASKKYNYSGFGDVPILMIVNPMDVLAVPVGEVGKLRTCRWFFAMTLTESEKYILDDKEFDVTDLGDIFEEKCSQNVQEYVKNSFAEEIKRHTFTLPSLTGFQLKNIVISLDKMKESIAKRVNIVEN